MWREVSDPAQAFTRLVDSTDMPRLLLEYPNGRAHEVEFDGKQRFNRGDEFDLYGRRWQVVSRGRSRGPRHKYTNAIVCRPLTASPLPNADTSALEHRATS